MNDFDIFVDSSANIPNALREERGIGIISYPMMVNGAERQCYENGISFEETAKELYNAMREGAEVKTSLVNEEKIANALTPSLEAGRDVLFLTIASGISGTYQQGLAAQKQLEKQYPDRKIVVADSTNASMGEGLLALKVADLRDMGESIDTCYKWLKENAYKMNSLFTVSDLKYLRKGGRISATLAIAGSLLNIKPILKADGSANAKISFAGKERGRKKALAAVAKMFGEIAVNPETQTVAITHADCEEDALALAEMLRAQGVKDIIIEYYDLCTGAHVGPGTVALFFMGKDRRGDGIVAEKKPLRKNVADPVKR